ncbi:hypothetical protein TSACC_16 [Terrimicrobium sacchariphilum]|uniref:DUF2292 domain-containing protein n=1 Tax=Terrimicrobium sacchariphilum TaxID=690879 RepID=A0A146G3M3_TERSA|nr:YezD family protein [Terrimicrobium sacchariphilum]GAT31458.1 hypothetical protein TSACC_16 [Terrimicrobium sacchariphilum]
MSGGHLPDSRSANTAVRVDSSWQDVVERQVGALRFGSLQITVHEGKVVQIERSVKVRLDKSGRSDG